MSAQPANTELSVDRVTLTSGATPSLEFEGTGAAPERLELVGSRLRLSATVTANGEGWRATMALLASRWGSAALAPPSGTYRLMCTTGASAGDVRVDQVRVNSVPEHHLVPELFRIAFLQKDEGLSVTFAAPLTEDELGPEQQARLAANYRSATPSPRNAVFFESFYGHSATCNPLALDREIAKSHPTIERYWGVRDASVAVPEGAIALIEGSEQWWSVRASARLIVINDWLRNRYRKRRHQTVLQTWHGTMLKKLALTRVRQGIRPALATLRERSRWDILLAQNGFAAGVFRRAYAYFGPIWQEGYPRDDVLVAGDREAIRARLDIAPGTTVLLYAPTWRDDRPDHIDHLNVARFAAALGPEYVTLIRGHSRTLTPGEDVDARGVLDVTSYPDVSELFLAADALITDYSSVMFDFSVTGKPIYFFTPDLERYREVLRGFYFDLLPVAPGPIVQDAAELAELVRHPDAVQKEYAAKYAAWRERFNPRDDGHAAERVVARLIREKKI